MMRLPRKAPFIYIRWSDGASVLLTAKKDITEICIKAHEEAVERFPREAFVDAYAPRLTTRRKVAALKIGRRGTCCEEWMFDSSQDDALIAFFQWCEELLRGAA